MYNLLGQHPKIFLAGGNQHPKREIHFFDRDDHFNKGLKWYKNQFPRPGLSVDKSPTYLQVPYAPTRAKKFCPDARIIIMLRNPVDRAYSDWIKRRREGHEKRTWQVAFKTELGGYDKNPEIYWMSNIHLFGYLDRSDYIPQLDRWYRVFRDGQIMVIQYEYWRTHLRAVMNEVFKFVGVKPVEVKHGKQWQKMKYKPMRQHVRVHLKSYFEDRVRQDVIPFAVGSVKWE